MDVRTATTDDLDWIVAALQRRRAPLVPKAPIFWHPAPDAAQQHRAFLQHLMTDRGAKVFRTDESVLIAAPRRDGGWTVDDLHVAGDDWVHGDGGLLWDALARECPDAPVRLVCPVYEEPRAAFAQAVGLEVAETWWLRELPGSGGGAVDVPAEVPGVGDAFIAGAPPVYAPPGPMLMLAEITDPAAALPAAVALAQERGCAGIVAVHHPGEDELAAALTEHGFRRHCDYYDGTIRAV